MQNVFHQGKEMRNISPNTHYIVLFKSPRDRQQISILARQVNPGRVQEFMKSYEKATSQAHGYLMLDLKPTTDDEERLKTNTLPVETSALQQYARKKSYRHLPNLNAMYNTEKRMQEIMEAPQLSSWEKTKLYSDQLNRLLMLKNKTNQKSMETLVQRAPSVLSNVSEPPSPVSPEPMHHQYLQLLNLTFLPHLQQKNDQSLNEISFTIGLTQQIGRKVIWRE